MLVYLAGAIDRVENPDHARNWRAEAERLLSEHGIGCFNPLEAWTVPGGELERLAGPLIRVNKQAVAECNAMLVEMWHQCSHVGTVDELLDALDRHKPVVVMLGDREPPAALVALKEVVLTAGYVEEGVAALVEALGLRDPQRQWEREHPVELRVMLEPGARQPSRHYPGDAGVDLWCNTRAVIEPDGVVDVGTGVRAQLPVGYWGLIIGRSSTLRQRGLLVNPGVIDNGWRGELLVNVRNLNPESVVVNPGERLAQLILLPLPGGLAINEVSLLSPSERGERGFGSTG